jgi:hypothetical protein
MATKQVQIVQGHKPGRAMIIRVGVYEKGRHGLTMERQFYSLREKKQAEEYAAWLRRLLELEASVAAGEVRP